jgi:hypothetical protein
MSSDGGQTSGGSGKVPPGGWIRSGVRALLLRLYRFTRVRGLIVLVVGLAGGLALLLTGGFGRLGGAGGILGMALAAVAMITVGATRYPRSAGTVGHERVVPALLESGKPYCLMLRPFGQDAEIVLPKIMRKGRTSNGPFTRNVTMEQVVTAAARSALDLSTYGIVDQHTTFAPPGPTLVRAADTEWRAVAGRLIRNAHVIVLILPPDREFGDGFVWEVEWIRKCQAASRVVVVLPPADQDPEAHQAALHRSSVLLALLDGTFDQFRAHEYELMLPDTTLVIRSTEGGAKWWQLKEQPPEHTFTGRTRKTVVADRTYADVLQLAFMEIDHEHP